MAIPPADDSKVKILCITPISTTDITASLAQLHPPTPDLDIAFIDGRGLADCPPAINDDDQAAGSAAAILPRTIEHIRSSAVDAVLVCCFSDHPLVAALARKFPGLPVTGILQAALQKATADGGRFGIVTTSLAWEPALTRSVEDLGFAAHSAGVVSTGLGVLELGDLERRAVVDRIVESCAPLVKGGAGSIILGCAGMAPLEQDIRAALPPGATTVDGVRAGIEILARIVRERPRAERAAKPNQEAEITCEV
ncbi:hydantoin racemase [Colletotrichum plurivorum]|uniref:Hydantoin racemase n=1 Tax=Colletotrichum plurivorum TaxID=2175906 RepID=A0A8H6KFF0_9PEZI|nr:hydantoin racemase [Colletotrichum plurivorum]